MFGIIRVDVTSRGSPIVIEVSEYDYDGNFLFGCDLQFNPQSD